MPLEPKLVPYEFLARWDETTGAFKGAHVIFFEHQILDGVTISLKEGQALTPEQAAALGFPFEDVLAQLQADALVRVSELEAQVAAAEQEKAATAEAHAAEMASLNDRIQGDALVLDTYRRDHAAMLEQLAAVEAQLAEAQESPLTKALNFFKAKLAPAA